MIDTVAPSAQDEWLFGWDSSPGIVSVWADRAGRARLWHRHGERPHCTEERFRPWLFAAHLDDLHHVGAALVNAAHTRGDDAPFSYREMEGPTGTLRYVLSARDGRALQQALLQGARRRVGPSVYSLRDLPDYYMVGSVEQYLMATGRVCFQGLAYADLHRLQLDLETTALSPTQGRIFLVAVRDSRGLATIIEAPTEQDEAQLISGLCTLIRERDPDVIENHNLVGFDLPFLAARADALGVPLRLGRGADAPLLERYDEPSGWGRGRRMRYSIVGRELIDTLDAVRRHDFVVRDMPGHGLKAAARYFDVAAPDRTYIAGPEIYRTYQQHPDQVCRYALDDVAEVDGLSQRLLGAAFALAGMAPRRYERIAAAGPAMGILEPMLVRAYLRAGAALPAPATDGDTLPPHQGGATILYAGGVARHVIKADIASMYPSIMRTFRIGPACDRIGALLSLVDRLLGLRLVHKRQARTAPPQSAEARGHDAMQAAMKILLNSAYGYMGAGRMALFADRAAADEVTRRGREILGQVAEGLRAQGLALLEADTDGVFAAAPDHWTEQDERACVASVAATLPDGIALEYEGRYQAMLSHEVKNYALLTYDGELLVRGGAFRSSRSEPFGERFLRDALRCLLAGDVPGIERVYHETVMAVRERRVVLAEVATVARLTKAPEEYAATRSRAREAPYEALLAAGRTTWQVGERVRFYRAADGTAIWLPDVRENDQARADDTDTARPEERMWPPYAVTHYLEVLQTSYVSRLRKAFAAEDFAQLFRPSRQAGLFDRPITDIAPHWITASDRSQDGMHPRARP